MFGGLFLLAVRQHLSVVALIQALLVAAVTAGVTTYTTTQVIQRELLFVHEAIKKHDDADRILNQKLEGIALKQAAGIANAEAIHLNHETRLQTLENRRR